MGTEKAGELHVHADWYADGIEEDRDLWRLDLPGDIQIQASIDVTAQMVDGPPQYGKDAQIFVEHDVRGAGPNRDERTKYSCDSVKCSRTELYALLAMDRDTAANLLLKMVARVKAMPSDPEMCKPMPPSKPAGVKVELTPEAAKRLGDIMRWQEASRHSKVVLGEPYCEPGDAPALTGDERLAADVRAGCDIQRGGALYRQMPVIIGPGIVLCDTAKRLLQCMQLGIRVYQQDGHRHIQWPDAYSTVDGADFLPEGEAARAFAAALEKLASLPTKEYGSVVAALDRIDATLAELKMPPLLEQFEQTWGGGGEWLSAWGFSEAPMTEA